MEAANYIPPEPNGRQYDSDLNEWPLQILGESGCNSLKHTTDCRKLSFPWLLHIYNGIPHYRENCLIKHCILGSQYPNFQDAPQYLLNIPESLSDWVQTLDVFEKEFLHLYNFRLQIVFLLD